MRHRSTLRLVWRSLLAGAFVLAIGHAATAGQDTTGPQVTVKRRPVANGAGWNSTNVTVSFTCSDPSGVASCPDPVLVTSEGASILVSETATDALGNQTPISVTLKIDRTAPTVTLDETSESVTTSASSLSIGATVSDGLSGLGQAWCNGLTTTITAGEIDCSASLSPGINGYAISVVDLAGNTASHGLTVTRTGTSTSIAIAPSRKTMLVGREATLALTDEFGAAVAATSWTSADPSIASVSVEDDVAVVTGVAGGTTTITAEWSTLSATATVTVVSGVVLPSGAVGLPVGTTEWTVTNATDLSPFLAADPIDAGRFSYLLNDYNANVVRAIGYNGQEVERYVLPPAGALLMAHARGGFLVRTYQGLSRLAPPYGERPWAYRLEFEPEYILQASNGTLYLVYQGPGRVEVVDGDTGALLRREYLPLGRDLILNYDCFPTEFSEGESVNLGVPVIDAADRFRLPIVITNSVFDYFPCGEGTQVSYDRTAKLLTLTSSEATYTTLASMPLYSPWTVATDDDGAVMVGGLLSSGGGFLGAHVTDSGATMHSTAQPISNYGLVVGDAGIAYAATINGVIAFDTTTGATVWSSGVFARPLAPLAGGGVAAADEENGTLLHFDATGTSTVVGPLAGARMLGIGGSWIGESWDENSGAHSVHSTVGVGAVSNFSFARAVGYYDAGGNWQNQGKPQPSCAEAPFLTRFLSLVPGNNYTYRFAANQFAPAEREAVEKAFDLWSQANTVLLTTFSATTGPTQNITIFKSALAAGVGGNMSEGDITDGMISGGVMRITSNTSYVWKPAGFLKVALHEIGHFMGLEDITINVRMGGSVMNQLGALPAARSCRYERRTIPWATFRCM